MVVNTKSHPKKNLKEKNLKGIIHWPHPGLFKLRYKVKSKARKVTASKWWAEFSVAGQRFEKRHSGAILERLALAEVQFEGNGRSHKLTRLDSAIRVLEIACNLPENLANRRLFELRAKLICLQHPDEPQKALQALEKARIPIDQNHFITWHAKTVNTGPHGTFFKKLVRRIEESHGLVLSASSSGKDTA